MAVRAYVLERHGGPEVLRARTVPVPVPGPGEVRVRVEAIGVNYAETLSRKGRYGWAPAMPYTLGMEATGTIDLLGAGVDRRAIGERVIVGAQYGAYAEQIVVPEHQALPAIAGFSIEENAAIAVNYLTAWVALMEMARLRATDRVLVTAAAGGVGSAAVQIATRFGSRTVGLAGSDVKLEAIRALGAESAVNYRRTDFEERLRAAAGPDRFDVVVELGWRRRLPSGMADPRPLRPGGRGRVREPRAAAMEPALLAAHLARSSQGRHPLPRARLPRPSVDAYRLPPGRPASASPGFGQRSSRSSRQKGYGRWWGRRSPSRRWPRPTG